MGKHSQQNTDYLWWISGVFLILAISFVVDLWGDKREIIQHPLTDPEHFTKNSVREASLKPVMVQDGYRYRCNDCHNTIEPSKVQKSFFSAHPDIILDHGVNNYCMTCHSVHNREMLVDINKQDIPFAQSEKTCLQCHGPIYRDWESGVHGRMNDYWDPQKGEIRKLTCVACHDPHQPKFKAMHPAPSPNLINYHDVLEKYRMKESSHE